MLFNYLKIGFRNIWKNKIFSTINMLGLAFALTASLLIGQYIYHQLSFDNFHPDGENTYRIVVDKYQNGKLEIASAYSVPALGPAIKAQIPGIQEFFRLHSFSKEYLITNVLNNKSTFHESNVFFADPASISYLSIELIFRNGQELIAQTGDVLISESMAIKYFGKHAFRHNLIIGKTLNLNGNGMEPILMRIQGIFKDYPSNSHLNIDFLIAHRSITDLYIPPGDIPEAQRLRIIDESWGPPQWYTYVVLNNKVAVNDVEKKITDLVESRNKTEHISEIFHLQPITKIYLHSHLQNEFKVNGNLNNVIFLSIIIFLILAIAWTNYINLTTSKFVERAKEIGIRKVIGAHSKQFFHQVLVESLLVNVLALFISISLFQLILPVFEQFLEIEFNQILWQLPMVTLIILGLFIIGNALSVIYPALLATRYRPVTILKGKFLSTTEGKRFRDILVIFQFTLALALIAVTLVVNKQNRFMHDHDLGFKLENTLVVKSPELLQKKNLTYSAGINAFKNSLNRYDQFEGISWSNLVPGKISAGSEYLKRLGSDQADTREVKTIAVDNNYFQNMGIDVSMGQNFSDDDKRNKNKIIINEAAIPYFGFTDEEEAIGQIMQVARYNHYDEFEIIGVINDYHHLSVKSEFQPMVFVPVTGPGFFLLNLKQKDYTTKSLTTMINLVQIRYEILFPGNPFEYFFLDDFFNSQYKSEVKFEKIFGVFSLLTILIACLGLLGLMTYTINQKSKEIGIRKILGARTYQIMKPLMRNYFKLLCIATIISIPIIILGVNQWLKNFAFKVEMGIWIMIIPAFIVMGIMLITLGIQTAQSIYIDPVKMIQDD